MTKGSVLLFVKIIQKASGTIHTQNLRDEKCITPTQRVLLLEPLDFSNFTKTDFLLAVVFHKTSYMLNSIYFIRRQTHSLNPILVDCLSTTVQFHI
jgi:hypothetical protein